MARFGLTLTVAIILIVSFQEALAIKCWHCNSTQFPSCGYPFEEKKLQKSLLIECQSGTRGGSPICVKSVSQNNEINRYCVNNEVDFDRYCWFKSGRAKTCEKCAKDECNSATQYGPAAAFVVAIPMAIMKILSLL